jgi:hypothetical protein
MTFWGVNTQNACGMTSTLGGGGFSLTPPPLYTREGAPVRIGKEAVWSTHRTGLDIIEKKNLATAGKETPVVKHVARSYTDWAIAAAAYKLRSNIMIRNNMFRRECVGSGEKTFLSICVCVCVCVCVRARVCPTLTSEPTDFHQISYEHFAT